MNKPYQSAPLSELHLRVGALLFFANEVNRGLERKEMNPMGNLYMFDDHSEIRTPANVPENWPHGLVRIFTEQAKGDEKYEFTLQHFDPAMSTAAYDAKRGGGIDQQGIRFLAGTGWMGLTAHYLMVPEYDQVSYVPLIGKHTDSVDEILEEAKLGGYDRKVIRETYEATAMAPYENEDDIEHARGVPHTYHNWLMLNALIIAKIVTLRALALAEHGENVLNETLQRDSKTGAVLPIDVSQEEGAQ